MVKLIIGFQLSCTQDVFVWSRILSNAIPDRQKEIQSPIDNFFHVRGAVKIEKRDIACDDCKKRDVHCFEKERATTYSS